MPFGSVGAYTCRALQVALIDYYGRNAAQYRTYGSVSLLRFLLSPQNTRNFRRIEVESIPGKRRPVAFLVNTPYCYELCTADGECTDTKAELQPASQEIVFDLTGNPYRPCNGADPNLPYVLTFEDRDLERYCTTTDQSWVQEHISRYLARFEEALDLALAETLATKVGTTFAGDAITNLPFFVVNSTTGTSVINHDSMWFLDQNFNDIDGQGQYALVGGKILNKIGTFQKWAGLNDMGIDLSKIPDLNPYLYYDRNMDAILGQQDFLQIAPGAVQLVTWNRYKGEKNRKVTDLYSNGTITSPATGLEIDWKWSYDYSCEVWRFEASLHAELAVVPAGGCGTAGVNGLLRYHDCGAAPLIPPCPEVIP